jgi:hypothetical protein
MALALLSTLQRADVVLPTAAGPEIRLRHIAEPTAEQKLLPRQLGINPPVRVPTQFSFNFGFQDY